MRTPLAIPVPTAAELEALEALYRTTRDVRLRTRAQIVLLAAEQRLTAPAIAAIVREDDQTVRNWLNRYLAEGIAGLHDRPMPGAPAKLTPAYEAQLVAAVRRRPRSLGQPYSLWTLQRLADYLAEQTGIRVSYETVRVCLKRAGIVLSRPQHKISSPDPEYAVKKTVGAIVTYTRFGYTRGAGGHVGMEALWGEGVACTCARAKCIRCSHAGRFAPK